MSVPTTVSQAGCDGGNIPGRAGPGAGVPYRHREIRHPLTDFLPTYGNVQMVIGSFALLLGLVNLFMIHGEAISKRSKGWINSLAFFVAFFAIMMAGFVKDYATAKAISGSANSIFTVFFDGFLMPLSSTMFSIIAFYIASAAYRAFRIRSTESALMMITASIIMLGLVPAGQYLTSGLPGWLYWLRLENVELLAAQKPQYGCSARDGVRNRGRRVGNRPANLAESRERKLLRQAVVELWIYSSSFRK